MIRTKLSTLALASVLVLPLATAGCSQGSSPTEPAFDDELASASSLSAVTGESRGSGSGGSGGDDDRNDDNDNNRRGRGRGGDDDRNDDNDNNRRRGRGGRGDRGGNDDNNRPARNGREFEGAVASVGSNSVTLAGGLRIVVNGGTQWSGRGDLLSLSEIADSLADGNDPRVEGRGTRQADGSIVATTIKAEHVGD